MKRQKFLAAITKKPNENKPITLKVETIERLLNASEPNVLDINQVKKFETLLSFRLSSILSGELKLQPFKKFLHLVVKAGEQEKHIVDLIARQIACSIRAFYNSEDKESVSEQYILLNSNVKFVYKDYNNFVKDLELINKSLIDFGVKICNMKESKIEISVSV